MRILWLCNIPIPEISSHLNKEKHVTGGWISGLYKLLIERSEWELCIAFPDIKCEGSQIIQKINDRVSCFQFRPVNKKMNNHHFRWLLENIKPDAIQIWGAEYPHSCAMMQACNSLNMTDRVVIHIQSYLESCARHKSDGLPLHVIFGITLKDTLRANSVWQQSKSLERRSHYEKKSLKLASHVIGRTNWDRAHMCYANPKAQYHHCDEALREPFYNSQKSWSPLACEKHSLLISNTTDALKGLHVLLRAMPLILRDFPDANLYAPGPNVFSNDWKTRLKSSYYSLYIKKLICKYNLKAHVHFIGNLNAVEMRDRLLNTHVAVLASSIENGSIFVAEAKILGTPVVASYAGGVTSIIEHGTDGFFYQHNEHELLAYYIKQIFSDDIFAKHISENAIKRAQLRHDKNTIWNTMESIYTILSMKKRDEDFES